MIWKIFIHQSKDLQTERFKLDWNVPKVFWEASSTYIAKLDPKTPPCLIYQEIVPFQSEYKHSAIIWGIPLLNGFNGSVFLSELFGCPCSTNVHVVSFQTIWFFKWFWQQIHLCCYVWSHFQHMPEYVFTTKKWNFSNAWPSWMGVG